MKDNKAVTIAILTAIAIGAFISFMPKKKPHKLYNTNENKTVRILKIIFSKAQT